MTENAAPTSEPLFDVSVATPSGAKLEDVDRKAREAGIAGDRVDALMKVLRSVPQAKIGSAVPRSRADRAKQQFEAAGLVVIITPLLSLEAMREGVTDGMEACPSCNVRVALPESRKCPNCGVYVDKVTEEVLLRRKLLEQERSRLAFKLDRDTRDAEKRVREQLEAQLRAKIRAELEEEFGVAGDRRGGAGKWVWGTAVAGLIGAAFVGGQFVQGGEMPWQRSRATASAKPAKQQDLQAVLDRVGPRGTDTDAATAAAATSQGAAATGDPDIDDPLVQAAGGKRIGAKGLSVEQAVAAAQGLARTVGYTGPVEGVTAGSASLGETDASAAAGVARTTAPVAAPAKALLLSEFASHLAELGQQARALEMIKALKAASTAQEPAVAAATRLAAVDVQAWSVQALAGVPARKAIEAALAQATAAAEPVERARCLMRLAVVLAQQPQLAPEVPLGVLSKAADVLRGVADEGVRVAASGEWMVALGETLAAEAAHRARAGQPARAVATAGKLGPLARQAPSPLVQARLLALESQAWHHVGQLDKAAAGMDAAIALLATEGSLPARAAALRALSRLGAGAEAHKVQAAVAALLAQARGKPGLERLEVLSELALLQATAGVAGPAEGLKREALASDGVGAEEAATLQARLLVRTDLVTARLLHQSGSYARSEALLRRVGGYLL